MEQPPNGLPIIDLSASPKQISDCIVQACEAAGCFYIKNHGVASEVISNAFRDLEIFFTQPTEAKVPFYDPNGKEKLYRGYSPFETHNISSCMGKFDQPNDPVEKFGIGPLSGFVENIWPLFPPTLRQNLETYYQEVQKLAERLMKLFSVAAKAPTDTFFYDQCHKGEHMLRANYYPKPTAPDPKQISRFPEHCDITAFTILATDDCKNALHVKNASEEWVFADPIPGTFFINLGDFMAMWTNDKWKATLHKVVWLQSGADKVRFSLPFFVYMNPGVVIESIPSCVKEGETPNYAPISHADYVKERMAKVEN